MDSDFRRPRPAPVPPTDGPSTPPTQPNAGVPASWPSTPTPGMPQPFVPPTEPSQAPSPEPQPPETPRKPRTFKSGLLWLLGGLLLISLLTLGAGWWWYQSQLSPVDASNTELIPVTIAEQTSPSDIATKLKDLGLIRSTDAFALYTRLTGAHNELKAGAYRLSPSESTPQIVGHLTSGKVDTFDITFLPGATLADHRDVLLKAGYSAREIDAAFSATYDSPLFEGRGSNDLEGYIYGETYRVGSGASVQDILEITFAEFTSVIEENDLKEGFAEQGLSLREGIILASIIQREAGGGDEAQIAQVFLLRKERGMELGSDVTYQYIADKTGVTRDINLDSPYNTRRYSGLPPGPIASPGVNALKAVAAPAAGDYVYFLSGDDDVTYFARTLQEHEANIANHCRQKCQII